MDKYAPKLLDLGLKGMIGKGKRSEQVEEAIVRNGSVYFAAVGGAGAILSKCIKKSTVIAYDDLGTKAKRVFNVATGNPSFKILRVYCLFSRVKKENPPSNASL